MRVLLVYLARWTGWIALASSSGVVVVTILWQVAGGVETGQSLWPPPRLWHYFVTTVWMSASAMIMSFALALPVAYALLRAPHGWQRKCLLALTIIPLFTMPSVFAYAWFILAAGLDPIIRSVWSLVGMKSPGFEPLFAAWVLANWLWPIPALVVVTSFQHVGIGAYQLARLDASPRRAFVRAGLPVMRAPLMAAGVMVFILAATDSTASPLVNASETWSVELTAIAGIAMRFERPAAFLFWQSWPMLAIISVGILLALPGVRQMRDWADDTDVADVGQPRLARSWLEILAIVAVGVLAMYPLVVFAVSMSGGRYTVGQSFSAAWHTIRTAGWTTSVVALCSAAFAAAIGMCVVEELNRSKIVPRIGTWIVGLTLLIAVLPPPLIGTSLVSFYSNATLSPPDHWNLYDNLPVTWIATLLARYAFLPVCLMWLLNRRIPQDLSDQAVVDGANRMERLTYARLPLLWRPLLCCAVAVACLSLVDVTASSLVQPPQWGDGSLAVYVDSQMHYGRHNQTIALTIIMVLPGVLMAVIGSLLASGMQRRRAPRALPHPSSGFAGRRKR